MTRYAAVFAQPAQNLAKWYGAGVRLFHGWASTANTAGANPQQDRKAQLDWRAAVKALGPDALYVDYPLPDWRTPATPDDIAMMVKDPQCYGFMGPDEPNLSPPTDTTGKVWRVSLVQWLAYWGPILAADPGNTKVRACDFGGEKLSAAWGWYTGDDAKPYADTLTDLATNWHARNKYGDTRADCDVYPGRAVRMLGRIAPNKPRWYISECANEQISSIGRAPTAAELQAQYNGVMAEDAPNSPIKVIEFFPQRPRVGPSHVFDNTTADQFEACKSIIRQFLGNTPQPSPEPTPDPVAVLAQQVADLKGQLDAQARTLSDVTAKAAQTDAKLQAVGKAIVGN